MLHEKYSSNVTKTAQEVIAPCATRGACCRIPRMDLIHISSAADLLSIKHPHFGRIQPPGLIKTTIGTVTGTSQKAVVIADYSSGIRQTVAVQLDPRNFMITIASSYVLVTLKEGANKHPVVHKPWKRVDQRKGEGVEDFFGTVTTYMDSDGLKWEHRFDRPPDEDELIGFGSNEEEILIITLESIHPMTVPGVGRVIASPSL